MELVTFLSASDITSMRLAVKFATYSTPRGSSSTMSETCPPTGMSIGTTVPNVAPHAAAENKTSPTPQRGATREKRDIRVLYSAIRFIKSYSGALTHTLTLRGEE